MRQEVLQLTGGGKQEKRREHDYYPTPPECTIALMDFIHEIGADPMTVWEPACGDGAISKVIESYGHQVISTDLNEYNYGTPGVDYLKLINGPECDAIITNPPFNLSEEFIRKASNDAGLVAMLLKSQYWHSKNRLKLFETHPPAYVLPLTWRPNFAPDKGSAPTMEVHWTVWIKGQTDTRYVPLKKPNSITKP
jgi:hypothetical protein